MREAFFWQILATWSSLRGSRITMVHVDSPSCGLKAVLRVIMDTRFLEVKEGNKKKNSLELTTFFLAVFGSYLPKGMISSLR
jgi:hypothetical protein